MKMTTLAKASLLIFISTATIITACKKDNGTNNNPSNNDSTAANLSASSTTADNSYDDVFTVALQTGSDNGIAYSSSPSLGQVGVNGTHSGTTIMGNGDTVKYTVSPAGDVFPKTIVADFGAGVTSATGITRKGVITFVFSGRLIYPGTTVSATFTDYYRNGYKLEGTYTITNTSAVDYSTVSFTTSTSQGKITYPDATTWYTYSGHKTVVQTVGISTLLDATDDEFSITGGNTFASSTGNTLKDSITTALVKANSCSHISSGIISFTFNDISGTLDYGAGTCDSLATIKVGAINITVGLK